ncbi:glycosyltransferase [Haliangium ochraceum]|uniref:Glycosyl transferase group 1 n=1 Tax=Haliangium ochraceum (strain DSM 14365 / JCM 11303 / SMP-2) TaxID=502025 RepID=D0LZR8_HALO1|nr:glycosyltransferase [Haliangium ochraceum]ACY18047.1 glycosyl transferase group 1 [Haliangium ochraceum DSM 14365]
MKTEAIEVRVDLHVHSSYSDTPQNWFLRTGGVAESYTSPQTVYETAMRRGMSLVTLTDHNTIAGALELAAKYDNVFLSEEITARFPEDGCIVRVAALDISEAQHEDIARLRDNVYDLAAYLAQESIAAVWCHPLSDVNARLSRSHLERCFLMFRALELRNGSRDASHEQHLAELVTALSPAHLARFAEAHPQTPAINLEGRYAFTGGSDDYGGLAIARAYTAFHGSPTGASAASAVRSLTCAPAGECGDAPTIAHNAFSIASGHVQKQMAQNPAQMATPANISIITELMKRKSLFEQGGGRLDFDEMKEKGHQSSFQDMLVRMAEPALVHGWREVLGGFFGAAFGGRFGEAADAVSQVLKASMFDVPYIMAYHGFAQDRLAAERLYRDLAAQLADAKGTEADGSKDKAGATGSAPRNMRVAVISDTLDHVNGVALGLRRLHAQAQRSGLELDLVAVGGCDEMCVDADGLHRIPSIYSHTLEEYPELPWNVPHLPSLLRYLVERRIDMLQCSTPGPAGIAGLIAARLLGIPVVGQYHTDVPEYTMRLMGDPMLAGVVRIITSWFYRTVDRALVPSQWVARLINDMGVPAERITRIPRGIDLDLFRQAARDEHAFEEYGLNGEPKVLYVGRVSKEKGLSHLAAGFRRLSSELPGARLVVIGDGPYADELATQMPADKVIFTGPVTGEKLARLYASSDVFAFPSETETFGNVVVEAQATGLPVVVADRGAARENMREGVTGMVVDPRDPEAWCSTLKRLLEDSALRKQMSSAAQEFAQRYRMDAAAHGTFEEYARILDELRAGQPAAPTSAAD